MRGDRNFFPDMKDFTYNTQRKIHREINPFCQSKSPPRLVSTSSYITKLNSHTHTTLSKGKKNPHIQHIHNLPVLKKILQYTSK